MSDENYEPFGDEWRAEMMKMTKAEIIDIHAHLCKENLNLKKSDGTIIKEADLTPNQGGALISFIGYMFSILRSKGLTAAKFNYEYLSYKFTLRLSYTHEPEY